MTTVLLAQAASSSVSVVPMRCRSTELSTHLMASTKLFSNKGSCTSSETTATTERSKYTYSSKYNSSSEYGGYLVKLRYTVESPGYGVLLLAVKVADAQQTDTHQARHAHAHTASVLHHTRTLT